MAGQQQRQQQQRQHGSRRLERLVSVQEAPRVIREPFLLGGYRPLGLSVADSIRSCTMWMSNETLNVWTHLVPGLLFLWWAVQLTVRIARNGEDVRFYMPLLVLEYSSSMVLLVSCGAHCLNCLSARARHTCFFCDYGAIGVYGIASGTAHFIYCGLVPSDEPNRWGRLLGSSPLYTPIAWPVFMLLVQGGVFWLTSMTRHHWKPLRFVIRTFNYVVAFNIIMVPFWSRYLFANAGVFRTTTYRYFLWGYIWNGLAAVANVTKVPERLFPGRFDKIGHSHQWMHIFLALSIWCELRGVEEDISVRFAELVASPNQIPLSMSAVLPILFAVCTMVSIYKLHGSLQENGDLRAQAKGKVA